ncbi:MAG: BatA domain-containing protein [Crocinitomicaceae bacterium]
MNFLYPGFLWAFAVLIIPVIIHLFNFKRYKTIYFSSLMFVRHVDQQTKSTQKLKHVLILISRLLAFIFLVLAFAQPYFSDGSNGASKGTPIIAMYIDNSFSMQARGSEGELLSEARENARSIIDKSPVDARFIIGTNDMSGIEEHFLTRIEAYEKLDKINLSPISRSTNEIIKWQAELLNSEEAESSKSATQYVFFSDFQKKKSLKNKSYSVDNLIIYPVQLKPENESNVYIDSVWFTSPIHKKNTTNEINLRIGNHGKTLLENVEVQLEIDVFKKTIFVELPANQKTVTTFSYSDKTTGIKKGKIHLIDDHVLFDDAFYISYEVKKYTSALVLNGEDAVPNIGAVLALDNYYKTVEKELTALTKDDFNAIDIVFINGSNPISAGIASYLTEFSSTGGSIALFPGSSPVKSEWNGLLNKLNLPGIGSAISSGTKINSINFDDPFFSGVFESKPERLNLPSVSKVFQATPNSSVSELITLKNGLPLFASNHQKGNHFMFYSSLSESFGGFTKDALFSTIILRISELSQRVTPDFISIGSDSRYPIYATLSEQAPIHIKNELIDFIPPSFQVSGTNYISLSGISEIDQLNSGNYDIVTDKPIGAISLNYTRNESILNYYTQEEIKNHLANSGFKTINYSEIGQSSTLSTVDLNKPLSYWKICVILTLIFVAVEMLLVRFLK